MNENDRNMLRIPESVRLELFLNTDLEEIPTFCRISKVYNGICSDDYNWRLKWKKDYGEQSRLDDNQSWRYNWSYRRCLDSLNRFMRNDYTAESLYNMKLFKLVGDRLEKVPESIGCLKSVKQMTLFDNRLKSLPDSFSRLKNLEKIVLTKNRFTDIPDVLFTLPKLREIWLNGNPLNKNLTVPEGWTIDRRQIVTRSPI